jgi:hypothetical protein
MSDFTFSRRSPNGVVLETWTRRQSPSGPVVEPGVFVVGENIIVVSRAAERNAPARSSSVTAKPRSKRMTFAQLVAAIESISP